MAEGDLFKCKNCDRVKDIEDKRVIRVSRYDTKSSGMQQICGECFTSLMNGTAIKWALSWKEWPKRTRD